MTQSPREPAVDDVPPMDGSGPQELADDELDAADASDGADAAEADAG